MQYRYRIKYRHPRTEVVGVFTLHTAAEMAAERFRLEALGYVVPDVLLPLGERPKLPLVSQSWSSAMIAARTRSIREA